MHSKLLAVALGACFAVASIGAEAMPTAPVDGGANSPHVTLVAEGCGPGFAIGPGGGCRRIGRRPVVVVAPRPAVVVAPRRVIVAPRRVVVAPRVRARCGVRVGPVAVREAY